MNQQRTLKMLNIADAVSKTSDFKRYHLGAVIANGSEILSVACNQSKSHPLQKKYNQKRESFAAENWTHLHAEIACISKVKNKKLLSGSTIYISRKTKHDENALARPCKACMQAIIDHKIKKIIYTTDDGFATEVITQI
jgi:deoxycytidylate deaminase